MDIDKELKTLIAEKLPQAVGEELQKVLTKAKLDANKAAELMDRLQETRTEVSGLLAQVGQMQLTIAAAGNLTTREAAVEKRERDLEIATLKTQLAAEGRVALVLQDTIKGLVRNTEFRESVFNSVTTPVMSAPMPGSAPYQSGSSTVNDNTTATKEAV